MLALPAIEAENQRLLTAIRTSRKHAVAPADDRTAAIADRRITRERACDRKRAYRTPDFAEKQAVRLGRQFGRAFHVYFCPFCACYHLATDKPSEPPTPTHSSDPAPDAP